MDACPAELMPEMRQEIDSMRGKIYSDQDGQVHFKEEGALPLPKCQNACPISQDVRGYIRLIARKQYKEALELIRSANALPSICGFVCHHPCESACVRGNLDDALSIRSLKRFAADLAFPSLLPAKPVSSLNKKVSIIGSGPAGLAAAYELAKMGYAVEVIESYHRPGGLLAWGIPEFRLPREILQRDIDFIKQTGVEIRTGIEFGKDITLADLEKAGTDAVIIATGTQTGLTLALENEDDYEGYQECLQFLRSISDGMKIEPGRRVIVVGGGNAAMDSARSALKQGAAKVFLIYRRGALEMPADKEEVKAALAEGVEIRYFTMPLTFITQDHRITGLTCARTELKDRGGRPSPVKIEGSDFIMSADMVISAVGQKADHEGLTNGLGGKRLEPNTVSLATNLPKVFAAGDFVQGSSTVVEAMANGKKSAMKVHEYLSRLG
jgi:NADPH-dependent glutamate synthase beta subunit-like oxidoreductase